MTPRTSPTRSCQRPLVADPPRRAASRSGFSLIELMVVVGIIVLLAGLTVGVSSALNRNSETSQMEQTLQLLDSALTEWDVVAERSMTWGPNTSPGNTPGIVYDIDSNLGGGAQMENVLKNIMKVEECKVILSRINPRFFIEEVLTNGTKQYGVIDPWDRRMVIVHPGRVPNASVFPADATTPVDPDGTIRTDSSHSADVNENRLGICQNRRLAFICRGPDGELGRQYLDQAYSALSTAELAQLELSKDNIYSYQLGRERP